MKIFMNVPLLLMYLSLSWAQAPGDEADRCTVNYSNPPVYNDTEKNLMDSWNYENLLPGNGTGHLLANAVWNDYSYDGNDEFQLFTKTFWRHAEITGICRRSPTVCGFHWSGTRQNNWMFTQFINKSFNTNMHNNDVRVNVFLLYKMMNCRTDEVPSCVQGFNLSHYITNSPQLPSLEGNGYMNRNNYQVFAEINVPENSILYTNTYYFTLSSSTTGFYIAVSDNGTCMEILRLRVYRNNCKGWQNGLTLYPDTPAPVSGTANVQYGCVSNAGYNGTGLIECFSEGVWGDETPVCGCKPGYQINTNTNEHCEMCPRGTYQPYISATYPCQPCPSNTDMTQPTVPYCMCLSGYFRKNVSKLGNPPFLPPGIESYSTKCTKPPSCPKMVSLTNIQSTSMTLQWSHPDDDGGRDDLYYEVVVKPSTPDSPIFLHGIETMHTLSNLKPFTEYCVTLIAHNGVSNQDTDRQASRSVVTCNSTLEDLSGPVENLLCFDDKIIVWGQPTEPNGIITGYQVTVLSQTFIVSQTLLILEDHEETSGLTGTHTIEVAAVNTRGPGNSICKVRMNFDRERPYCAIVDCSECPRMTKNLVVYPKTTVSDDSGSSVTVTTECVENAQLSSGDLNVQCLSTGDWDNQNAPQCQCVNNFMRSGEKCIDPTKCSSCPENITVGLSLDCQRMIVTWLPVNDAQNYLVKISATGISTNTETVNGLIFKTAISDDLKRSEEVLIKVGTVLDSVAARDQEYNSVTVNLAELQKCSGSLDSLTNEEEELTITYFIIGLVLMFVITAVTVFFLTAVICLMVNFYKEKKYISTQKNNDLNFHIELKT